MPIFTNASFDDILQNTGTPHEAHIAAGIGKFQIVPATEESRDVLNSTPRMDVCFTGSEEIFGEDFIDWFLQTPLINCTHKLLSEEEYSEYYVVRKTASGHYYYYKLTILE